LVSGRDVVLTRPEGSEKPEMTFTLCLDSRKKITVECQWHT
jgi:hypothetical protein